MTNSLRVACYERVSTEEQVKHISIDAQIFTLDHWVDDHGYINAGHYTDRGVSGGKPIEKRPAMYRLLQDVQSGLIDLVIFTKLDRWFRSLPYYYKAQEILDKYHCSWQAVEEDYETITASGKFKVNIMLSVAESERLRTSERIKSVFEYKRAKGEWASGGKSIPWGYKVVDKKRLIKDTNTEKQVTYFWQHLIAGETCAHVARDVNRIYGVNKTLNAYLGIMRNPIYKGFYNGLPGFCEPYVEPDQFDLLNMHPVAKRTPSGKIYLFSGLLICPECGNRLTSTNSRYKEHVMISYRCRRAYCNCCTYRRNTREWKIEERLLDMIFPVNRKYVVDNVESTEVKTTQPSIVSIQAKMQRLAETYTDGLITKEAYKSQLENLKTQMVTAQNVPKTASKPPIDEIRKILQGDLREAYTQLSRAEKQHFWRMIIKVVRMHNDGTMDIEFL